MTKTNILVLIKTSWRRLEGIFWKRMSKVNIFVLINTPWRGLEDVFWRWRRKTSSGRLLGSFLIYQYKCKKNAWFKLLHDESFMFHWIWMVLFILFCLGYLDLAFRWRGLPLPYVNFRVIKASATKFCNYTHYYACLQFFLKYLFVMPSAFFWRC